MPLSGGFHNFFLTMSYLLFLKNAIKVNETSKFNESREIIIYLTCEEHCTVPYTLFFWFEMFWLKEIQISDMKIENGSKQPKDNRRG